MNIINIQRSRSFAISMRSEDTEMLSVLARTRDTYRIRLTREKKERGTEKVMSEIVRREINKRRRSE